MIDNGLLISHSLNPFVYLFLQRCLLLGLHTGPRSCELPRLCRLASLRRNKAETSGFENPAQTDRSGGLAQIVGLSCGNSGAKLLLLLPGEGEAGRHVMFGRAANRIVGSSATNPVINVVDLAWQAKHRSSVLERSWTHVITSHSA